MNFILFIKQSFSSLKANKLRSFLSTLWIIIWILSFVIMLSIWEWAKKSMIESLGTEWNLIKVERWFWSKWNKNVRNIFTKEIAEQIPEKVPNIKDVLVTFDPPGVKLVYKIKNIPWSLSIVSQNFFQFKNLKTILWSTFWKDDYEKKAKIAIIWYKLVKQTFWEENPIWKNINIWWQIFTVSWVLAEKWWWYDDFIFIPSTTSLKYFWKEKISGFEVNAKSDEVVNKATEDLKFFLMKKATAEKFNDLWISVRSNKEFMKMMWEFQKMFSYFLTWIWAISLIVWWIWIMNIMLVSVTERTREVWIRKAIWASDLNILMQFLVESIILTLIWSFIAIWLAYGIASILNTFLKEVWFEVFINSTVLMTAISVSVIMWISFGLMPAYKAARLKPIDALHFE